LVLGRALVSPLVVRGANVFVVLDTTFGAQAKFPDDWLWKWGADAPLAILTATRPNVKVTLDGGTSLFARHFHCQPSGQVDSAYAVASLDVAASADAHRSCPRCGAERHRLPRAALVMQ
jgi:hypothetical protein